MTAARMSTLHLFQIVTIYVPGAASIPAVLVASFYTVTHDVVVAIVLVAMIVAGVFFRVWLAERLGLPRDYE